MSSTLADFLRDKLGEREFVALAATFWVGMDILQKYSDPVAILGACGLMSAGVLSFGVVKASEKFQLRKNDEN